MLGAQNLNIKQKYNYPKIFGVFNIIIITKEEWNKWKCTGV